MSQGPSRGSGPLGASEEQGARDWRRLLESLPHWTWTATAEGLIDYFSPQAASFTAVPEDQLLGSQWMLRLHPDDRDNAVRAWSAVFSQGVALDLELRVMHHDGGYRWLHWRGAPQASLTDPVVRWTGTALDITERRVREERMATDLDALKRTEAEAARASQLLHLAVQGSDVQVWDFEMPEGCLESCNPTFVNVWEADRYTGSEVPQDFLSQFALVIHPDDQERIADTMKRCLESESLDFEAMFRTQELRDGIECWNLGRGVVTRAPDGKPLRLTGASVDITQLKIAEAELQHARSAAEAANRAKDDFLANVSHEIRTPMNAILVMTELALGSSLTEHQRMLLSTVKSAADNLLVVVNDLLDSAKIEAGKLELDPTDFSLRSVVAEALRALAPRAHDKGLELLGDVSPDVPDRLVGDAGRLRQVLLNIVGNAVKFTHDGEVLVQVAMTQGTHEGPPTVGLQFTVHDTGIGIAHDQQERIFHAFEQEDTSTTRRFGGTGLGLSISRQLVTLMGGTVSLESETGRGSTFRFTATFSRQSNSAETGDTLPSSRLRDLRVLVVDDNPTSRRLLESWVRGWHMKPSGAGDAVTAIEALWDAASLGDPYTLVLLDERMPDADRWSFAAQIHGRTGLPPPHVIMLTRAELASDPTHARELGVGAQVLKPVQPRQLLDAMLSVTDRTGVEVAKAAVPAPAASQGLTGIRILLAEDDDLSARFMVQLLADRGCVVRLATDGRAALTLASQGDFDVMLLDLHMAELDGFDVARAIRQRQQASGGSRLPIAALTARSRAEDRARCLAAGMDDFLTKPVRPADLLATIARLASRPPADTLARSADFDPNHLLDPVAVLRACDDDEKSLRLMCRGLQEYLPKRMSELTRAAHAADAVGVREAAHKLSALLFAFSTVAGNVASRVEDFAAAADLAPCAALVMRLDAMSAHLLSQTAALTLEGLHQEVTRRGLPSA
jgi:two-component system, sensor histidine kinase and response regulator